MNIFALSYSKKCAINKIPIKSQVLTIIKYLNLHHPVFRFTVISVTEVKEDEEQTATLLLY